MKDITLEARKKAVYVLEKCISPEGLYASGTKEGYTSVWSRDSNISFLGGALIGDKFKKVFTKTLSVLAQNQSPRGQIPGAIGVWEARRRSNVAYNSIDSTLWFIIGHYVYAKSYHDKTLTKKHKKALDKAFVWLEYRDSSVDGLPEQLPTTDWQDAFPHNYGHTINTQALYYAALRMMNKQKEAKVVKDLVSGPKRPDITLFDKKKGYFLPWAWKDHDGDREEGYWFDSLGNFLAIISGLANRNQTKSILDHVERKKINRPYPVNVIFPPIKKTDKAWQSYFSKCDARKPYDYLNGGIWPFVGGFYVASLVKAGQFKKAEQELEMLAKANYVGKEMKWEFNEWLDGMKGKPRGGVYQAWSAGGYIFAHESVKKRKVPFFSLYKS